ncbi:MAG TPA: anthranilate synthase component I [Xanthobacteraceae bacterium]|jgi:anthranilate synthase component 1|nr:anthranilate synthase component I [Xanthobacteraceae bacterium]
MHTEPSAQSFAARYAAGEPQVVWTTLVADLETPVSAYLKIAGGRPEGSAPMSFLLESVEGGAVRGRYSIIGLEPDLIFRVSGRQAEINRTVSTDPAAFVSVTQPPLAALRTLIAESRIALPPALPPMAAGVFGYLGYDMVRLMEDLPPPPPPDRLGIADAMLIRPTLIVVFDAVKDTITIVTPVRPHAGVSAETARLRAAERLSAVVDALDRPLDKSATQMDDGPLDVTPRSNATPDAFKRMVTRAKDYIAAGDIFQVVLSQRFEAPFALPAFSLYRALRRVNPSPYLFFLDFGTFAVAGSSPEILVKTTRGVVTIRPIAGTRPRGATPHEDQALETELLADPKERAEHLMLLDLGRNDVGRVAKIGSVKVTDRFFIERYSQVMHIVSNVEGELRADRDAIDALAAGFPAGTVSGAPKVRAMQIIDELESEKRSLYAGCVGYFSAGEDMDTCIALRTALIKDGTMYVQAGAGIVADSDPDFEQQECINKAAALFRAAEEAKRFASAARRGQ